MVALGTPDNSHGQASSSAGFLPGVDYLEKEIPTLASVRSIRSLPINLRSLCLKPTFSKRVVISILQWLGGLQAPQDLSPGEIGQ